MLTPTSVSPTPTAVAPVANTLLLYTTTAAGQSGQAYWAFRTLPTLPRLDPAAFDALYGADQGMPDFSMFFADFRPQLSPDGRYVVVPGLHSYPEYGVEGTGTWLLDLVAGEARQLLPDGVIATWSPASDAITYVDGGALYTLSVAPGATPQPLLTDENLWPLFAKWSPAGDSIVTLISAETDESDPFNPRFFAGLWLVPVDGSPPRLLTTLEMFAVEYVSDQIAWSPDGRYVLAMNAVYDLEGTLVSPEYDGAVEWLPEGERLMLWGGNGLDVITVAGEVVTHIDDLYSDTWAFSHDGRRLAYVRREQPEEGPVAVAVFDLESGDRWDARAGSAWPIRWSADDNRLILGVYERQMGGRPQIVSVSAAPDGAPEKLLLDYAELIEVVEYPPR